MSQVDGVREKPGELQTELTFFIYINQRFEKHRIYFFYISNYVNTAGTAGAQLEDDVLT